MTKSSHHSCEEAVLGSNRGNGNSIDSHDQSTATAVFGFWIYIMSDCILFATLFAAYAVLRSNVFGGPGMRELVNLHYVLVETIVLLTSSFTYGLAMLGMYKRKKCAILFFMSLTIILGLVFLSMEFVEFHQMVLDGNSWARSAFLSAFFTLVGTHGLHVLVGLVWMFVVMVQVMKYGIVPLSQRKMMCLGLFWHFLDIVWIFVFSIVYLMGAV